MGVGGCFLPKNTALVRQFLADTALLSKIVNLPGFWFAVGCGAVGDLWLGAIN